MKVCPSLVLGICRMFIIIIEEQIVKNNGEQGMSLEPTFQQVHLSLQGRQLPSRACFYTLCTLSSVLTRTGEGGHMREKGGTCERKEERKDRGEKRKRKGGVLGLMS